MRVARVSCFVMLHVFVTLTCSAQFIGLDAESAARVMQAVTQRMQADGIIGCSVGIVKNGRIVYLKGFGYRDLDNSIPATEYTIYRTGSIAKPITATLALQLAEEGRLSLDADVRTLVPEYPAKPQGTIKIGHLLNHRSGIRHYAEYDSSAMANYETSHSEYNAIDALDVFKAGTLSFTPGYAYQYTTFGYNLLGAVVERASGMRFQDLLQTKLRRPLGLPYLQPEIGRLRPYPGETKGYDYLTGTLRQTIDNTGILYKVPGGGMLCTVIDLCLFMQGMMDGRVFDSSGTLDVMGTAFPGASYGLGMFVGTWNGHRTLSHGGGQEKTYSHFIFVPDTRDGVVVMTNTYGAPADPLSRTILDLVPELMNTGVDYSPPSATLEIPRRIFPDIDEVVYAPSAALQWTAAPLADRYIVQSGLSPLFADARSDTVRGTTLSLRFPVPASVYYWRVRAMNPFLFDTARSPWSAVWRFRTPFASGIGNPTAASGFRLYPNPVRNTLYVSAPEGASRLRDVELWSLDGRRVREWRDADAAAGVFDVNTLRPGSYLFRLRDEMHREASVIMLIER